MQLGLNCVTAKSFVENAPRATRVQRFAIVAVMHNRTSVVFEQKTKRVWRALGLVSYGPTEVEKKSLQYHWSLYAEQDINAGEALTGTCPPFDLARLCHPSIWTRSWE